MTYGWLGRSGQRDTRADPLPALDRRLALLTLGGALVFVAVTMGASLVGLRVFAPVDRLGEVAPWAPTSLEQVSDPPHNDFVRDTIDAQIPGSAEFARRLHGGDVGMWSSIQVGGSELGATPNLAAGSPVSAPYLLLPLWLAPAFGKLLELIVALGGTYLYLRRLRLGRAAAVLGGFAFATSAFVTMWTGWTQARAAVFIPLLFWAIERVVTSRRAREVGVLAVAVACMVLGGFPSVTAYALYTAAVYALVRAIAVHRRAVAEIVASLGRALAGVVLGIAVTAVQLVPFVFQLGQVSLGDRSQTPDDFLPAASLVTSFAAYALGAPGRQDSWAGPRNPIESYAYVGAAVVALIAVGAVCALARTGPSSPWAPAQARRGVMVFFLAAAAFWGLAAFSGGRVLELAQRLPAMDWNAIARSRSVLGFFVVVLAAVGFQVIVDGRAVARLSEVQVSPSAEADGSSIPQTAGRLLSVTEAAILSGAILAILAALVRHGYVYARDAAVVATYTRGIVVGLALLVVAAAAAGVAWSWSGESGRRAQVRLGALAALPLLVVGQATTMAAPFWTQADRSDFYPVTATHAYLEDHLGDDRVLGVDGAMMPGTNEFYGLRSLDGHAFIRREMATLVSAVDPRALRVPTLPVVSLADAVAEPELLDRLAVRYLVAPPDDAVPGPRELVGAGGERVPWHPGRLVRVPLPAGGLRAIGVVLTDAVPENAAPREIDVRVLGPDGTVLAAGSRLVEGGAPRGLALVALAGEDLSTEGTVAELTLDGAPLAVTGSAGVPQLMVVRPGDDGLRLVLAGEATVYERPSALPRIRWAASADLVTTSAETVAAIRSGSAADVLLAVPGPVASGADATVQVGEDSGDKITATVRAGGAGYLVVADALQGAFIARLDGATVPLRPADHGYVAVAVPPGTHVVELKYRAPYAPLGLVVSAVSLLVIIGLFVPTRRSRRTAARERAATAAAVPALTGPGTGG